MNPTKCQHPSTRVTYKTSATGVRMYCNQCTDCGAKTSTWLPKAKITKIWEVAAFDEALEERGRQAARAEWDQQSQQLQAERDEKSREWWTWYNRYLQSDAWRDKRLRVLKRDDNTCQACLRRPATQVHHLSYQHVGMEPLFELTSVCDICHEALHPRGEAVA